MAQLVSPKPAPMPSKTRSGSSFRRLRWADVPIPLLSPSWGIPGNPKMLVLLSEAKDLYILPLPSAELQRVSTANISPLLIR